MSYLFLLSGRSRTKSFSKRKTAYSSAPIVSQFHDINCTQIVPTLHLFLFTNVEKVVETRNKGPVQSEPLLFENGENGHLKTLRSKSRRNHRSFIWQRYPVWCEQSLRFSLSLNYTPR